ncbi:hypothetical protein M1349_05625 [Patescibacteria group bacterium]|nr:hypothetical protein [Patescibacteria group bacterium]
MRHAAWPGSVASLNLGPDFEMCPGIKDFDKRTPEEQEGIRQFYRVLLELEREPKPLIQRLREPHQEAFSKGKERF